MWLKPRKTSALQHLSSNKTLLLKPVTKPAQNVETANTATVMPFSAKGFVTLRHKELTLVVECTVRAPHPNGADRFASSQSQTDFSVHSATLSLCRG